MIKAAKARPDRLAEIDGRNGVWSIPSWCSQFGCSEPYYYALKPQPHQVKIGRLKRITESPRDYAERVRLQTEAA
jgi:hypothetical protein